MRTDVDVRLGDRYRLVSRIAVGGMGEVWRARDEALDRDVAIKVLREEFAGDEGFLERFRTEARNSAVLSHPNIAALYDYGEEDGSAYLVMELVLGEPLSDLLDREPVLPAARLLPILAQTARGLHAAHRAGVVHRDVKPQNILLARLDSVRITDFGISTAINQIPLTDAGMVMGTAQYLSPEQAMGGGATPSSDVYSLGVVAYEALAGHRPFTGTTAVAIAVAHVSKPMPPLPATVDREVAALVRAMLSKSPTGRPRSAEAVALRLEELARRVAPGHPDGGGGRHADDAAAAVPRRVASPAAPVPAAPASRDPVPGTPVPARAVGAHGSTRPRAAGADRPGAPATPAAPSGGDRPGAGAAPSAAAPAGATGTPSRVAGPRVAGALPTPVGPRPVTPIGPPPGERAGPPRHSVTPAGAGSPPRPGPPDAAHPVRRSVTPYPATRPVTPHPATPTHRPITPGPRPATPGPGGRTASASGGVGPATRPSPVTAPTPAPTRRADLRPRRRGPGGLPWLVVAAVIVVIALLGAWFASWLMSTIRSDTVRPDSASIVTSACAEPAPTSGMICSDPVA